MCGWNWSGGPGASELGSGGQTGWKRGSSLEGGDCLWVWEQPLTCIKAIPELGTLLPILEMRKRGLREV